MKTGAYSLELHPPGDLITTTLSGFFTVAGVMAYAAEAEQLIERTALLHGGYRLIIDVSGCAIQPQDVITAFSVHVDNVPRARRLAVVTGDSIIRMQMRRIIRHSDMAMVESAPEALVWCETPPLGVAV
jgi:hypothetical protein